MNKSLAVGAAVAGLCIAGVGVAVAAPRLSAGPQHTFTIRFPTASGLVAGSDVLEAGAKVGTITDIKPLAGDHAAVTVQVEDDHWPMHQGLTADIRPKSLLGEKYVDLHDGSAKNPTYDTSKVYDAPGDSVPVELDTFVNSLDTDTRSALRILLNDLGAGVAGRGYDLNQAILTGQTLNNRDPDLDRILVGLDGLFQKLTQDDQLQQMSQLIDHGKATLDAVEAEQAAFSRSFTDAELALSEANSSFDTVIANLRTTLNVAPALLSNVTVESDLLGSAADATLASHTPDGRYQCGTPGCQVTMLAHSILGGPYTTGGAQEWTPDGKALPIFRVCLGTPDNGTPSPVQSHSCSGTPSGANLNAAYAGGAGDVATLAAFLGV